MHLIPIPINQIHLQEAEQSSCDQEAVLQGKAFDVAHVQGEGVGGRGNGTQTHQLTHNIPHTNTYEKKI